MGRESLGKWNEIVSLLFLNVSNSPSAKLTHFYPFHVFLQVWNAARAEFDTAPFKPGRERERKPAPEFRQIKALFQNTGTDERYHDVQLYYGETTFFGNLGAGKSINVNTFATHVWNIKSPDGTILKSWEISGDNEEETFSL